MLLSLLPNKWTGGYGCDSIDNDCDDVVDDCTEDNWPPEISAGPAITQCSNIWFKSEEEALACVRNVTSAADDCDESLTLSESDFALSGDCFTSMYTISISDKCNNAAEEKEVPVLIDDGSPPNVTCSFGDDSTATQLILVSTGASVLENTNLVYTAMDGCNGDVDVTVEVFSNEIEDFQSQKIGILFEQSPNDAANLYIAKGVCSTDSNGQCIKDPILPDNRVYTVVITGTDLAGFSASTECSIVIVPKNSNPITPGDFDVSQSKQRFFLTSYTSTFEGSAQP